MILSQEFIDGLDLFATKWQQKKFSSADELYEAVEELQNFVDEHREIDYVQIDLSKPDTPTEPLIHG